MSLSPQLRTGKKRRSISGKGEMPQERSSAGRTRSALIDSSALDKGRLLPPLYTRDQAKKPRHSPGRLPSSALLTCSSCQPPSAPFCAGRTATSRSAPPFLAFPGQHTHHPQNKQTPGPASPRIPPPASHPRCACARLRPTQQAPPTLRHTQAHTAR